jgi:arylamine N-acetyltransferase
VYATGPGAATATGSYEQNLLFHVMLEATGWERAAAERLADRGTLSRPGELPPRKSGLQLIVTTFAEAPDHRRS